jgi:hypothetical protein
MPWCKVLSFTEPFSYQLAFLSVEVELFPTAKGKFCAELTRERPMGPRRSRTSTACLHRRGQAASSSDRLSYQANQPAMQHRGMDVLPGSVTHLSRLPKSELRTHESGILARCAEFA